MLASPPKPKPLPIIGAGFRGVAVFLEEGLWGFGFRLKVLTGMATIQQSNRN